MGWENILKKFLSHLEESSFRLGSAGGMVGGAFRAVNYDALRKLRLDTKSGKIFWASGCQALLRLACDARSLGPVHIGHGRNIDDKKMKSASLVILS